ncbi:CPBP family intramembrane glutamic endopeptidase [Paenibacillus sp. LjRoot56]|uniref:CPBP family intramembrane glutamic endopeptidase n=1 Tax=Paenibacillus sp. LjRoot56 TaxID=3342333 RepID=UPI003ECFDCE7
MRSEAKIRTLALVAVFLISIFPLVVNSLYLFLTDKVSENSSDLQFISSIIWEIVSLGVLYLVLKKQGRDYTDIGFEFRKTDILHGIFLFFGIYILYVIALAISPNFGQTPKNIDFLKTNVSIFYLLFIIINPFFEELIVRAYAITEAKYLLKNEEISVLISTVIQTSYHLYQGLIPALYAGLMFFVFSIYFVKSRRIVPVILVHLFFDFIAMIELGNNGLHS